MNNASIKAIELLESFGWTNPKDLSIEEIAWACGLIVHRKEMDGCEGRILMDEDSGIITVNSNIHYQPKVNYIIAHEIGHAKLHRNLSLFSETNKTLEEWYAKGDHETEANIFATELLMPADLFSKMVKKRKLNLELIEEAAKYFGASKTATFLRYRDLGDFPVMLIYIEDGIIKWKSHSTDFPFTWLPIKSKLPAWTVAGDYYYNGVKEDQPAKVDALEWFPEDYRLLKGDKSQKLWEQAFPATKNSIVTCIWVP